MKKILLVLIVSGLFMSCNLVYNVIDSVSESIYHGQELYYGDFPEMESFEDIADYLNSNIEYRSEKVPFYASSPKETFTNGYGNCEAFSLAFVNIAYIKMGIKLDLVTLKVETRAVVNGGIPNHTTIFFNGNVYDVYNGEILPNIEVGYIYYFDDVFVY